MIEFGLAVIGFFALLGWGFRVTVALIGIAKKAQRDLPPKAAKGSSVADLVF